MRFFTVVFLFVSSLSVAQPVSSVNFNYLYNLQGEPDLQFNPVIKNDSINLIYTLKTNNPSVTFYVVQWEKRESYSQRQGGIINTSDTLRLINGKAEGVFRFAKPEKPWLFVARVTNTASSKSWIFFKQIEAHYPVNGYLEKDGEKQWSSYKSATVRYTLRGSAPGKPVHFSFYKDGFPTPSPPFADKELKMDRFFFPDSTFTVMSGDGVGPFAQEGLYLAQEDTTSTQGFAFLIRRDPYPKYNKLADLKGPLLFVTTREENDKIGEAGEDKVKFDKVILDITSDKERARDFMRSYFKRVEIANSFFTSFKDGWETDRGMIFIVFGAPDEVTKSGQQEIWNYRNPRQRFVFTKSGSVYAPDHYVLVRDKQYTENWYLTIDLWRKSRF
ncbi:MAG: GWxTD domain-containing protein [Cyclobacteriaceae bacterium]|nr:GWxTD domain-containing protein [Cyclobacteriaceae bacterium]